MSGEQDYIQNLRTLAAMYLTGGSQAMMAHTWHGILTLCKQGGQIVLAEASAFATAGGGFTSAELAMMESVVAGAAAKEGVKQAAKRGMTMTVKNFMVRFGLNFSRAPKGPGPIIICVTLGTLLLSAEQAYAEGITIQSDTQAYQLYIERYGVYIARRMEQGDLLRGGHVSRPMNFDEWKTCKEYLP